MLKVTSTQKHELGITVDEDGEFWMPFDQFVKYFTDISVCLLFNTLSSSSIQCKFAPISTFKKQKKKQQNMHSTITSSKSNVLSSRLSQIRENAPHYNEFVFLLFVQNFLLFLTNNYISDI